MNMHTWLKLIVAASILLLPRRSSKRQDLSYRDGVTDDD